MENQTLKTMQEPKGWQLGDLHSRTDTPAISGMHYHCSGAPLAQL